MKLIYPTVIKTLTVFLLSSIAISGFSQTAPGHVLGTPCTTCPAPPKYIPPSIMNGNQANVTSYTASACGLNYVWGSVKLMKRGPGGGATQPATITISGIPTGCANILKAFLYSDASGTVTSAVSATVVNPALISNTYSMPVIGSAPDKCWSYGGTQSYRADITTAISGNGNYLISGLPNSTASSAAAGNDTDGASILIIFSDPSQTYTGHLTIADGAHVAAPGTITNTITIPAACANSTFAEGMIIVADLQNVGNAPMRLNSATNNYTLSPPNQVYWNVVTTPVSAVTAGQTTSIFGVGPTTGDCFNVLVSALYYRTTCNTCTFTPGSMSLTASSTSSCSTGTATANVSGGTGPYTYSWTPTGATTQTVSGAPGIYTVVVKDAACGQITTTVALSALPAVNINVTATQPSCLNPPGTATAVVSGGATASGFTVSWSPAAGTVTPTGTGSIASGLTVGTMTATVYDANGCNASNTFTVTSPAIASFSVNISGTSSITCSNPSVTINAINTSTLTGITYTWMPGNFVGSTFNATTTGVYTVTAQDLSAGSCPITQTVSVTQNIGAPPISVSPLTPQVLGCGSGCKTFTATTSGTANIVGYWYSASGPVVGPSGTPLLFCANAPGTYTAQFCSTINGCCAQQTVAVTSTTNVPSLTVTPTSFNGFTINCTNPKVIMDVNTNSITGPFGYTWTPLPSPPGTAVPSTVGGYTASIPGQYEIKFLDGNNCEVTTTISVYIDTLRPSPLSISNLPSNSFTLNCYNPCLISTAITAPLLSPSSYSWTVPGPLTTPSNTVQVCLANVTSSTAPTVYTVSAMGANGCVGKAKVNFYKDIAMPYYTPAYTPSIGITCGNPCVAMTPTTSGGPIPINFTLTSPPPTQTATTAGALMCVPGPYTMVYQNIANGCTSTNTVNVPQNVTPPAVVAMPDATINCGAVTATISAGTTTTSPTYSYTWVGPPGIGMSCLGGTACATPSVNGPGYYQVTILNTVNGCSNTNGVLVVPGMLNVSLTANPMTGFAPLNVDFNNTTLIGSTTTGSVFTTWSFGNGITFTTSSSSSGFAGSSGQINSTIYQSAGSYTVLLYMQQISGQPLPPGSPPNYCAGTATLVIEVELPSQLNIPNVFTPNGDDVNDVFFLRTTNLTEINCLIYDRWGVKMYEVKSETGNISWDGKTFGGKDVPAGTYFYIISAKGLDGKDAWTDENGNEVKKTGTISLFR